MSGRYCNNEKEEKIKLGGARTEFERVAVTSYKLQQKKKRRSAYTYNNTLDVSLH